MRWSTDDIFIYRIDSTKYDGIRNSANYITNSANI